jgi:hypothetical protein
VAATLPPHNDDLTFTAPGCMVIPFFDQWSTGIDSTSCQGQENLFLYTCVRMLPLGTRTSRDRQPSGIGQHSTVCGFTLFLAMTLQAHR